MTRAAKDLLQGARLNGYTLGAFNCVNLETAQAIVRAAELEDRAVILQVSENAARYAGLEVLSAVARILRDGATVPIILHYDHAESLESAKRALSLGFDAVMLETAHLPYDEAVTQLRMLAEVAHEKGALVEAEAEITPKGSRRQEAVLGPQQVANFGKETLCDLLAIDIGATHKQRHKEAALDLKRLEAIAAATELPLVLHGASGVSQALLKQVAARGISKVNIATELMIGFTDAIREALRDAQLYDPRNYLGLARDRMTDRVRGLIRALEPPSSAAPFLTGQSQPQ